MSKKMTFRKKVLAFMLCLMMGVMTLSGCEKEAKEPASEETQGSEIEVPEVKGKEQTVGAFTLLVPKGMDAEEGDSESEVILTDDDDNSILLQVYDKKEAKNYIKELQEEDEKLKEESFDMNGVSWSGVSNKKTFYVYGKVSGQTVLATGDGFKLMDDIPLAVLASLDVDKDAEPVSGSGSTAKGGKLEVCEGLYTIEYSKEFKEGDYSDTLKSADGSCEVYCSYFGNGDSLYETISDFEDYDCDEITTADGRTGYLYFDNYGQYFVVPLEYYYEKDYYTIAAVYIFSYGADEGSSTWNAFVDLCKSLKVDEQCCTDEPVESGSSDWVKYWEQGWYGWYIVYDGDGKYKDDVNWSYDCLAEFENQGSGELRFFMTQDDREDYTAYITFTHYSDSTDMGYLCSEEGKFSFPEGTRKDGKMLLNNFMELEIGYMDVMINPDYDMYTLDDYITFTIDATDEDGDNITLKGFFRPWGTDWSDVEDLSSSDLPEIVAGEGPCKREYMYPVNYFDWYVDKMYDRFPGIWAMWND